jgi:serine/threonine protein phosphatase PrpC
MRLNSNPCVGIDTGPLRIFKGTLPYPGLTVTRSFGDSVASRLGVLCEPEIMVHPISTKSGDFALVLASDGVWDGIPKPETVIQIIQRTVKKGKPGVIAPTVATEASKAIVQQAVKGLNQLQIDDNVSNVCVLFIPTT